MHLLEVVLRVSGVALALSILTVLFRRKLHRMYPWFTRYVVAIIAATGMRYLASGNPVAYFWVYWITETAVGLFALGAINQVFNSIFREDLENYPRFRQLLPGLAALLTLAYVLYAVRHQPAGLTILVSTLYGIDLAVHFLEAVALILCLLLQKIFAAAWNSVDFGLLAGFGISAAVTILADHFRSEQDIRAGGFIERFFSYAPPMAFIVAELVWLMMLFSPEPTTGAWDTRELVVLLKRDIRNAIRMWRQFGKRNNV